MPTIGVRCCSKREFAQSLNIQLVFQWILKFIKEAAMSMNPRVCTRMLVPLLVFGWLGASAAKASELHDAVRADDAGADVEAATSQKKRTHCTLPLA
jgi:hypothetical protein